MPATLFLNIPLFCQLQAMVLQTSVLTSRLLECFLAAHVLYIVVFHGQIKLISIKLLTLVPATIFAFSFLLAYIPLLTPNSNFYGDASFYCWIRKENYNGLNQFLFYFIFAWASIIFSTISFTVSMNQLKTISKDLIDPSPSAMKYRETAVRLCKSYCIASCLIIIPSTLNRLYLIFETKGSFYLSMIQIIFNVGKGWVHLFAFHYTYHGNPLPRSKCSSSDRSTKNKPVLEPTISTFIPWPSDSIEIPEQVHKVCEKT
ncbi:hypothetical protein BC833DRAFT_591437 [Globomyces pollinis-pini]|nr:hypothetical protein BC833DRAFT_591437 [Globomyces pollinis-pini]